MTVSYLDSLGQPVAWATAVVNGKATQPIWRVAGSGRSTRTALWVNAGDVVGPVLLENARVESGVVDVPALDSSPTATRLDVARAKMAPPTPVTASLTLALAHAGAALEVNTAGAATITVPSDAQVPFDVGTVIEIRQVGGGQVTVAAAGGVNVRTPTTLATAGQWSVIGLAKRGSNEWLVSGDLTAGA